MINVVESKNSDLILAVAAFGAQIVEQSQTASLLCDSLLSFGNTESW